MCFTLALFVSSNALPSFIPIDFASESKKKMNKKTSKVDLLNWITLLDVAIAIFFIVFLIPNEAQRWSNRLRFLLKGIESFSAKYSYILENLSS